MRFWLTALLVLALAAPAAAYTISGPNVLVSASLVEPTTNTDGTAITDLARVRWYWQINGGAETSFEVLAVTATGGNRNATTLTIPHPSCSIAKTLSATTTAINTSNVESDRTAAVTLLLPDRTGEPGCGPKKPKPPTGPNIH